MSLGENMMKCPKCNTYNEPDSRFCGNCGTKLEEAPAFAPAKEEAPAFAPAKEAAPAFTPANKAAEPKKTEVNKAVPVVETDEESVFAQGLPEWDIVPPQVVVRRKKK